VTEAMLGELTKYLEEMEAGGGQCERYMKTTKIAENDRTISPLYHLLSDHCGNNILFPFHFELPGS